MKHLCAVAGILTQSFVKTLYISLSFFPDIFSATCLPLPVCLPIRAIIRINIGGKSDAVIYLTRRKDLCTRSGSIYSVEYTPLRLVPSGNVPFSALLLPEGGWMNGLAENWPAWRSESISNLPTKCRTPSLMTLVIQNWKLNTNFPFTHLSFLHWWGRSWFFYSCFFLGRGYLLVIHPPTSDREPKPAPSARLASGPRSFLTQLSQLYWMFNYDWIPHRSCGSPTAACREH